MNTKMVSDTVNKFKELGFAEEPSKGKVKPFPDYRDIKHKQMIELFENISDLGTKE